MSTIGGGNLKLGLNQNSRLKSFSSVFFDRNLSIIYYLLVTMAGTISMAQKRIVVVREVNSTGGTV